jgi:zinc/manganese transport system ATP-binding protein
MTKATVHLENLTLGYDRHPAVHHLSGTFRPGSLTAVVGPNGAGKSTLLKGIAGTIKPLEGLVELSAIDARDIAFLPQQAQLDVSFPIPVLDTVCMGFWSKVGLFGAISAAMVTKANAALAMVGLSGFEDRPAGALSRGQFQRVLFARLLVQDARLILLDEPFTAIDEMTTQTLLKIIHGWHSDGRTVIAVIHDMAQVRAHFPDTLLLARERIDWGQTATVLSPENLDIAREKSRGWTENAAICERVEAA